MGIVLEYRQRKVSQPSEEFFSTRVQRIITANRQRSVVGQAGFRYVKTLFRVKGDLGYARIPDMFS